MATTASISIEQYLRTIYEPEAELVGGEVMEKNMGEYLHNLAQRAVLIWFFRHEQEWQIRSIQEQKTRFHWGDVRIPDISVWPRSVPPEPVFTVPQWIAIEILSPEDRQSRMQERIEDYRRFGITHIWIIDPFLRVGWDCSSGNWIQTGKFEVSGSPIYLEMQTLLSEMDTAGR
jgi:Uma2 family endonuclease